MLNTINKKRPYESANLELLKSAIRKKQKLDEDKENNSDEVLNFKIQPPEDTFIKFYPSSCNDDLFFFAPSSPRPSEILLDFPSDTFINSGELIQSNMSDESSEKNETKDDESDIFETELDYKFITQVRSDKDIKKLFIQLLNAIKKNNTLLTKSILLKKVSVDNWNEEKKTPLTLACLKGNTQIVSDLIEAYANVNICDGHGNSPLILSCIQNNPKIVILLILAGADVNFSNTMGNTPLSIACYYNHSKIVDLLINFKANLNSFNHKGNTPIIEACLNNSYNIVQQLISSGADVNFTNHKNTSPLHIACSNNNYELVNLLISAGAYINAQDKKGNTPLHLACANNDFEIVNSLIGAHARLIQNYDGLNAFDLNPNQKINTLLKNSFPDKFFNFNISQNALQLFHSQIELILLNNDSLLKNTTFPDLSILDVAILSQDEIMLKKLIELGVHEKINFHKIG